MHPLASTTLFTLLIATTTIAISLPAPINRRGPSPPDPSFPVNITIPPSNQPVLYLNPLSDENTPFPSIPPVLSLLYEFSNDVLSKGTGNLTSLQYRSMLGNKVVLYPTPQPPNDELITLEFASRAMDALRGWYQEERFALGVEWTIVDLEAGVEYARGNLTKIE